MGVASDNYVTYGAWLVIKHQVLAEWAESLSPMFMLMPDCQHIPSGHNSNISISIRMQCFDILMLIKCLICLVVPTSA